MTVRPLSADELARLVEDLLKPTALIELAVLAGCLAAAWLLVRLLRGALPRPGSIWFGSGVVDGVLFPVLALLFALAGRWALIGVVPLAVFRIVLPILVSLVILRLTVRVLGSAFPTSHFMRVVERSVSWLAWIGVVLWITGVLPLLIDQLGDIRWKIGNTEVSLRHMLQGALTAVVVLILALWISSALEKKLLEGASDNLSIRKMAANSLRALLLFMGLMFALSAAGIDLTALGVLGGALGVGIGFGLQKLASNYVSGFVILAERSVRIGDMVKVDGFEGRITDISTRYTIIRALSGRESIVPNEMFITQRVENLSLADPNVVLSTTVQVAYGTDLDALLPRLAQAVAEVPRVLRDPGPSVHLSSFASDGLELTVYFWIADPHAGTGNVRSAVNLMLWRTLNSLAVEIPFPQRVLHVATPDRPLPGADGPGPAAA
ncbi:MAG: mechanosensitive ion channel protein [Rubrivivax sp. SCN 70-15]|nr:MAG: mechanosensitive ion channel protein [Rubrivivax sp. SCN 70-15]